VQQALLTLSLITFPACAANVNAIMALALGFVPALYTFASLASVCFTFYLIQLFDYIYIYITADSVGKTGHD